MPTPASKLESKDDSKEVLQNKPISGDTCFCDQIYKLAKNPNKNEAKIAINEILLLATIDVHHVTMNDTAVSKLAAEGDVEAVNFLRKEFNASLLWMAYGYARGGQVAEANKVLALVQNSADRLVLLQKMALGYAQGGHVAQANKVLALVQNPVERRSLLQFMVCGYAQGGHTAEANKVLTLVQNPAERCLLLQFMALGYARGGDVAAANKVLALVQNPADRLAVLQCMASGYTQGGLEGAANKVLALAQNLTERLIWLQYMASGYTQGGHVAAANKVLALAHNPADRFVLLQQMVFGYARGGQVAAANKVLALAQNPADQLTLLQQMAVGYARGGHVTAANNVLVLAQNAAERLTLSKTIAANLQQIVFATERDALQTLATFHPDFQYTIASELKESAAKIDIVHLVPKATKLNTLMKAQKLNFNQAMGWLQPEMQLWLLQGPQLIKNKKLAAAMFLSVSTYLTSNSIPEMVDLSNKLSATTCRDRFFKNLQSHHLILANDLTAAPSKNAPLAPAA